MEKSHDFKWMFLDLNSYFASVEQQENPYLRGKPVAVVPMDTPYTCAIAASYEAKAYGIKTGTIIRDAKRMCPNLTCVLARHDVYVDYHHRILEEIIKHTPIHTVCSIDELSSRLSPSKRNKEHAGQLAAKIKNGLRQNIGEAIRCSIGFAPNSLLAKMATDMQKPDGLVFIEQSTLKDQLCSLKLTDIPGIGINMERRLHRAGIFSLEQFWNTSPKHARKIWGSVEGERFWYWLHGYDFDRQSTNSSMIGHSRILDPNLREPDMARLMARRLLSKATFRLRQKKLYAGKLALSIRAVDGPKWSRDINISPADDPFTFLAHLDQLWDEAMHDFQSISLSPMRFKKVSTLLMGFSKHGEITDDLFDQSSTDQTIRSAKNDALTQALDKLQHKYKKEMVTLGTPPKTLAGHVGTKIAFSRVPDKKEFWS